VNKKAILIGLSIAVLGVVIIGIAANMRHSGPVSATVLKKITFRAFAAPPTGKNDQWHTEPNRTTFNDTEGVLTLHLSRQKHQVILNQQATPQIFSDVPEQYGRMLNSLNQYSEFSTSFGTITLTHPKELQGKQSAVANVGGTLIFAEPDSNLSEAEWRDFFGSLEMVR
jgi:hypothetical protein